MVSLSVVIRIFVERKRDKGSDLARAVGRQRRAYDLRAVLTFGMGLLFAVLITASFFLQWYAYRQAQSHAERRAHYAHLSQIGQSYLISVLDQALGFRGYLATGDPRFLEAYYRGQALENRSRITFARALRPEDHVLFGRVIEELEKRASEWRHRVAEPNRIRRERGPLPDIARVMVLGKVKLDRIRGSQAELASKLREYAYKERRASRREMAQTSAIATLLALLVAILGILLIRFLALHVARPLAELAGRAERAEPFRLPSGEEKIQEVRALSAALYRLDEAIREREAWIRSAHSEAVELARFGEFVQQLRDEAELYPALVQNLSLFPPHRGAQRQPFASRRRLPRPQSRSAGRACGLAGSFPLPRDTHAAGGQRRGGVSDLLPMQFRGAR